MLYFDNAATTKISKASLEEYINICKAFNKYAILELKGEMSEENLYSIYEIINNLKYLTKVIFISFHKNNLIKLKDIYEEGNYQYLSDIDTNELKSDALNTAKEYNFDLDVNHNFLTLDFIKKCKESVWKYKGEWEKMSDRVGYWADMENPYVTYFIFLTIYLYIGYTFTYIISVYNIK